MRLNIYIQLIEQCSSLCFEINSNEKLTEESSLFEFVNDHDEIKMESDADNEVLDVPNLIIAKIKADIDTFLKEEKPTLTLCFRDKGSPSIQVKSIDDFEKELLMNDDYSIKKSYDTDLMNDSNKKMIAVFFETEAEILHGAIERYLPMEGRNIFEELQNAFNLRKLFYNKIITSVNTHFCLINDDLERTCLAIEENVESYDISSFKQIWLRERKEESFETLAPRKLYRFLEMELIKSCYETKPNFHDSSRKIRTQMRYFDKLFQCMTDEDQTDHVPSPYTIVAQSSGYGKSRSFELLSNDYFIVYTCLKQPHLTSFPRTTRIGNFLFSESERYNFRKNIEAFYAVYIEEITSLLINENKTPTQFYKLNETYCFQKEIEDKIANKRQNLQEKSTSFPNPSGKKIIFVFDEAKCLSSEDQGNEFVKQSFFQILTDVIKAFSKSSFTILVDAGLLMKQVPESLNFNLTELEDTFYFYEPISLIPTFDINSKNATIMGLVQATVLKNVCRFGRPLWGVWIKAHVEKKKIKKVSQGKIINIAVERLISFKDPNNIKLIDLKLNDILAIFASRMHFTINPHSSICLEMISKNLATCLRVTDNRDIIEIAYPSEPILAEASARLLNKFNNWSYFLKILNRSFNSHLLLGIDKKQAALQVLFLLAWDRTIDKHDIEYRLLSNQHLNYSRHVKVNDFMHVLFGEKNMIRIGKSRINQFKEAYMYFTHFAKVDMKDLNREKIIDSLRRGCALIPNSTANCDLIIPITFSEENFSKVSVILVKINKHKPKSLKAEEILQISSCFNGFEFSDNPEIILYIDFNSLDRNKKIKLINELVDYKSIQQTLETRNRRFHFGYKSYPDLVDKIEDSFKPSANNNDESARIKFTENKLADLKPLIEKLDKIDPAVISSINRNFTIEHIQTNFKSYYLKCLRFVHSNQIQVYVNNIETFSFLQNNNDELEALNELINNTNNQQMFEVYLNQHEETYNDYLQLLPFEQSADN